MTTVTPPPPPELPSFNLSNIIQDFTGYWHTATFGVFEGLLAGLFVFSVFLKTRSLSATAVAVGVVSSILIWELDASCSRHALCTHTNLK
ncbi:MAG: hypothetical protein GSR85_11810 [Desulfurococcales archaeon]|nr:hypothetical protein [Desulfurococcales archaeon]